MDTHSRLLNADVAATVFGQTDPGSVHLSFPGLSPQLQPNLVYLGQAGSSDGMTAAFQSPAGVYRLPAAQTGGAGRGENASFAHRAEPHGLSLMQFTVGGRVVQFRQADVFRSDAGNLIGLPSQPLTDVFTVEAAVGPGSHNGCQDFNGPGTG